MEQGVVEEIRLLKQRLATMEKQIGVKADEIDKLVQGMKDMKKDMAQLQSIPGYADYIATYDRVSQYISLESNGIQTETGSTVREMRSYILQMESDLKRTHDALQDALSIDSILQGQSFDAYTVRQVIDKLEKRIEAATLRVRSLHEEVCALVGEYTSVISRVNELVLAKSR
ncbi:hypothetical protein WA577_001686 [Blastocystis sp. JDR]